MFEPVRIIEGQASGESMEPSQCLWSQYDQVSCDMKGFLIWLLLAVILPIVLNLLTNDLSEVSPWWASNLIRFGARLLPEGWQQPYELRWLARIDALQGRGMKLLLAIWPLMLAIAVASLGLLLALIRRALL